MAAALAPQLDSVFGALADPTRRAIIERLLASGELSVGDVAAPFAISAQAISRHLQVLERGWADRTADRAAMALRARARRRARAGRELDHPPEAALDGGVGPARGTGRRANAQAEEVMSDGKASETTLRLERLIASPPEVLFALWTQPAQLVRWWAPEGLRGRDS